MTIGSVVPEAIEPDFTHEVDEPIVLHKGPGNLRGAEREVEILVRLSWRPVHALEVVAAAPVSPGTEVTLEIPALGVTATVHGRLYHFGDPGDRFVGLIHEPVEFGDPSNLVQFPASW